MSQSDVPPPVLIHLMIGANLGLKELTEPSTQASCTLKKKKASCWPLATPH